MRLTTAVIASILAVAYAQETTITPSSSSIDTSTTGQASILSCLEDCDEGDVDCQAHCVPVPNPSEEMISSNDACIAACPSGNGTEADIIAYSSCQAGCIATYYYTATSVPTDTAITTTGIESTASADSTNSDSESGSDIDSDNTDETNDDSAADIANISTTTFSLAVFLLAFAIL